MVCPEECRVCLAVGYVRGIEYVQRGRGGGCPLECDLSHDAC